MKLTIEIPDTYMLNMLCNASYRDYTALDGELEKAYKWAKENPEALADLDMPECWEPQLFAYLRGNAKHEVSLESFVLLWGKGLRGFPWLQRSCTKGSCHPLVKRYD